MKNLGILFIYVVLSFFSFGQNGDVEIMKDPRIDALIRKQGLVTPPATSPQLPGYRVQLFFDADRKKIDDARSKFIAAFPKVDSYVIYNAPNYFLKVGDFRTSLEAERVKETLVKDFPTSFIVKELINLPRIDQE
jgi:hypothetical protein